VKVRIVSNKGEVTLKEVGAELDKYLSKISQSIDKSGILTVGLHPDAQDYNDEGGALGSGEVTSVVMIGAIHEFGVGIQPKRPWLSGSIKKEEQAIEKKIQGALKDVPKNTDGYKIAMGNIGKWTVSRIRKNVETNAIGLTPNKPATARRKGGNQPMVDTGHLLRQVDWKYKD